jgi:hypothetical protein
MADAWYEVLSVLHLMAMVCLLQANTLLLPRSYGDGYAPRVSEGATTVNCTSEVSLSCRLCSEFVHFSYIHRKTLK